MGKGSLKPTTLTTLSGVFQVPKMPHKRDFLRENKRNIGELQRNNTTNSRQLNQQQGQQRKVQKQSDLHQQKQQLYNGRRSASHTRGVGVAASNSGLGGAHGGGGSGTNNGMQQRIKLPPKRSASQHLRNGYSRRKEEMPSPPSGHSHSSNFEQKPSVGMMERATSIGGYMSVMSSIDKQIQTEDIVDVPFLRRALKKCASNGLIAHRRLSGGSEAHLSRQCQMNEDQAYPPQEVVSEEGQLNRKKCRHKTHSNTQNGNDHVSTYNHGASHGTMGGGNGDQLEKEFSNMEIESRCDENENMVDNMAGDNVSEQLSARSRQTIHSNYTLQEGHDHDFGTRKPSTLTQKEPEQQLSARSRQTIRSTVSRQSAVSKKSNTSSFHKLGSRDDIRLPRYLEREKREKEEQRAIELTRDPNCPQGHYLLAEDERIAALIGAEQTYRGLIAELNHMPMTSQTLRIRNRKVEIEKELATIEQDIRLFSKPKVYVKREQ